MGTAAFNASIRALDSSTDARRFRSVGQQSDTWFHFESRTLASAISACHDNPNAPEVQAYVPWLACMDKAQCWKKNHLIRPGTFMPSNPNVDVLVSRKFCQRKLAACLQRTLKHLPTLRQMCQARADSWTFTKRHMIFYARHSHRCVSERRVCVHGLF